MNGCDILLIPTGTGILADGPCYITSSQESLVMAEGEGVVDAVERLLLVLLV